MTRKKVSFSLFRVFIFIHGLGKMCHQSKIKPRNVKRQQKETDTHNSILILSEMQSEIRLSGLYFIQTFLFMSDSLADGCIHSLNLPTTNLASPHLMPQRYMRMHLLITDSRWYKIHSRFHCNTIFLCLVVASHQTRLLANNNIWVQALKISLQGSLLSGDCGSVFLYLFHS